ncbi:MAG: hypothetical protein K9H49_19710 [Bacteroidales bacterium]|nr:hypothetical protein [Bacteroidales bacterium]MCF8392022.1 hypothetical protein [Bacteroidales bacterium]
MKKSFLVFCLLTLAGVIKAQTGIFVPYDPVFMTYNVADLMLNYNYHVHEILDKDNSIAGSPYVFDKFQPGIVYSKKEKAAFHLDLNINAFTNHFEFIYKEDVFEMPNFAFDSVVINGTKFIPVSIIENDKVNIYSMEVIDSDEKSNYLLKKNIVIFSNAKEAGPYNDAQPALFRKSGPEYFFNNAGNTLISLNNFKSLQSVEGMPDDIGSFIKKNKIRRNNEAGLKKLFAFVYGEK